MTGYDQLVIGICIVGFGDGSHDTGSCFGPRIPKAVMSKATGTDIGRNQREISVGKEVSYRVGTTETNDDKRIGVVNSYVAGHIRNEGTGCPDCK